MESPHAWGIVGAQEANQRRKQGRGEAGKIGLHWGTCTGGEEWHLPLPEDWPGEDTQSVAVWLLLEKYGASVQTLQPRSKRYGALIQKRLYSIKFTCKFLS